MIAHPIPSPPWGFYVKVCRNSMIWHRCYKMATNLIPQSNSTSALVWVECRSNLLGSLYRKGGGGGSYSNG
jgi:hypothetical protein